MDNKVLVGMVISSVLVVSVVGVLVFNPFNSNTSLDNGMVGTVNQTGNNTTTTNNNNILPSSTPLLTFIPLSSGVNSQSSSSVSPSPSPGPTPDPMDNLISLFDAYVRSTFSKASNAGLPGAAVVVVLNDKIIYMNCLGDKDLASGAPVTQDTLFEIGSCTKAFAATNIAQLVDTGLMNWNDTIKQYYPDPNEFLLYDADAYNNLTIADCLMHCSGLPAHSGDNEWLYFNDSYAKMLYNLRYVKNDTTIGSTHEYNNIIYALPGYCAARVTGTPWGDLIKEELLKPLGMNTATTNSNDYFNSPDHATCYLTYNDSGSITIKPYHTANIEGVGPAGSMGCSISQMANWLKFQIADTGMFNGQQIVSKANLDETRTGHIYEDPTTMYGFGWNVGKITISHGGDAISSKSSVLMYPSKGIGLVILTNEGHYGQAFRDSVNLQLHNLLQGITNTDSWSTNSEINKPTSLPDPVDYKGPGDLNSYAGIYFNAFYGNITIKLENDNLICYYGTNNQPNALKHWNDTTFTEKSAGTNALVFQNLTDGKYQQIETYFPDYSTVPQNATSTFNRTNST